jgi:hypothetical protein
MKGLHEHPHHKHHHRVTYTAILLGILLIAAGVAHQFLYYYPVFYHALEGYALIASGTALVLRALRPPIGFLRVITTLAGGFFAGISPVFFDPGATTLPLASMGCLVAGVALLGGSFTIRIKTAHHHRHAHKHA